MDTESPFSLPEEDVRALEQNDGFRIVRAYLSNQENHPFCPSHTSLIQSSQKTFILHRDILHSLLLPLLQIRSQAAVFAAQTTPHQSQTRYARSPTPTRSVVDLELAFRGAARGAFSWLQCFVAEERDWCSTKGCPACVVLRVLHSEPFIRIVVASCRLGSHLRDVLQGAEQQGSNNNNMHTSATGSSALPAFGFWLSAVHQAVSEDDFWGLHFWEDIEARAEDLELGVKDLIRQCCDICSSPRSLTAQPYQPRRAVTLGNCNMPYTIQKPSQPVPVKNGSLAKRQRRLQEEEKQWMRRIIEACWMALVQEAAYKRRKVSVSASAEAGMMRRRRSLTT